uniref:Uncharacterized protein n=1 Tax=Magallana gigas TaxID=29159 RepID=A0A8W8KL41_MAGGI|nr:uncharacterized protein LOC105346863 [Crassostrea gigas]
MSYLSAPVERLEMDLFFGLSSLKLKLCDAGVREAICFSKACVHAAKMSKKVYAFTEIFGKGHQMLLDCIKQDGSDHHLLQKLISYTSNLKEATKALHNVSGGSKGKESETEWAARLAVHFFSPLSLVQDYLLDSCSNHKVLECPCSCKSRIKYGDTSIGHPKTWFGLFDIVIGKALSPLETEVHIAATVIPEEPVEESESILESSEDNLSQNEVKFKSLEQFFPQIASQSIVFSFYQKKCNSAISIVPYIAVSKTHVQFHFYDCEKDLYFLSQEMPLFSHDDTELFLETVIATWLVLNYRYLLSGPTEGMVKGEKFGFHSNVSDEVLNLYRNEIKMGITELKTEHLDIWNGYFDQCVTFDASDTLKRKKNMKMQQS